MAGLPPGRGRARLPNLQLPGSRPSNVPGLPLPLSVAHRSGMAAFGNIDPLELMMNPQQFASIVRPIASATNGMGIERQEPIQQQPRRETGVQFSKRIREEEENKAIQLRKQKMNPFVEGENGISMDAVTEAAPSYTAMDAVSTVMPEAPLNPINIHAMRAHMQAVQCAAESMKPSKILPIEERRTEIMKSIRMNDVVIIEGPTGCGKTTQVPQFIMDDWMEQDANVPEKERKEFNIVVTQPRRIAAISVAQRVCAQRKMELGGVIGYQIGMDRTKVSQDTRLCYMTTGVLLQRIINTKDLSRYTHIIIDEIHERSVDTDFLLMVLRKLMWTQFPEVKLILMSATFDTDKLRNYFTLNSEDPKVPSVTPFVVSMDQKYRNSKILAFTLDLIKDCEVPAPDQFVSDDAALLPELYDVAVHVIKNLSMGERQRGDERGAVLVFLPGINEINELYQRLDKINTQDPQAKFVILPLHSCINVDEQRRCFEKVAVTERKIILATNIAESSITVPDVDYVIDFCLTKNMIVDKATNLPTLKLEWASKANCRQREGRTGRVRDGRVFKLVHSRFYKDLPEYPEPEIRRTTLEMCVLRTKVFNMGHPKELLALCLDPPNLEDIRKAVLKLKRLGALTIRFVDDLVTEGEYDEEDGHLTTLGTAMSVLPIGANLSKLIIMGYILGLADDAIVMAACLSVDSLFSRPYGKDLDFYKSKLAWADRTMCDLFAARSAFYLYQKHSSLVRGKTKEMEDWAQKNFIQLKQAREIEGLILELRSRLESKGIYAEAAPNIRINKEDKELLLKVMIAGAFYPNYFFRNPFQEETVRKQMPSHDPLSSIIISGLPAGEGVLYAKQLQSHFHLCSDQCRLDFEEGKVVVSFVGDDNVLRDTVYQHQDFSNRGLDMQSLNEQLRETSIKTAVYIACKMRFSGHQPTIFLVNFEDRKDTMTKLIESREKRSEAGRCLRSNRFIVTSFVRTTAIPPPMLQHKREKFRVRICHILECGHFFIQEESPESEERINKIRQGIQQFEGLQLKTAVLGMSVLVAIKMGGDSKKVYYRGVIKNVNKKDNSVHVLVVDSGMSVWASLPDLVPLDPEAAHEMAPFLLLPAQALQCKLTEIKPSKFRNIYETWTNEANHYFQELIDDYRSQGYLFEVEIYSVLDSVARVQLYAAQYEISQRHKINDEVINSGWGEFEEESMVSVQNHETRLCTREEDAIASEVDTYGVAKDDIPDKVSKKPLQLKGPYSPLEAEFKPANQLNSGSIIKIDRNSVNCVALEPDIKCTNDRLLVAATVAVQSESNKIVCRDTSMMPYIPGFASLMVLLFSPYVELRADSRNTMYTGCLSGLGADSETQLPYDSDHDLEIDFDALITNKDLLVVNTVRFHMSNLLAKCKEMHQAGQYQFCGSVVYERQEKIRQEIVGLLRRRRMLLFKDKIKKFKPFKWGHVKREDLSVIEAINREAAFPFIPVHKNVVDFLIHAKREVEMMQMVLAQKLLSHSIVCPVDGVSIYSYVDLANHLRDKNHLHRLKMLDNQSQDEKNQVNSEKSVQKVTHTTEEESGNFEMEVDDD